MAPLPGQLSEAQKEAILARGRDFVRDVRKRIKDTRPEEMKRLVNEAVDEVRRREGK